MHYLHGKCPKALMRHGDITKMGQECERRLSAAMVPHKIFITLTTTQQCLNGLKGWRQLSRNGVSGQQRDLMHNVKALNANLEEKIAAADGCYSHSQIL
jgi:hypothetical protein